MPDLPIYLDHNATTPCDPRVVEAMVPYFSDLYGNAASRSHPFGWKAAEAVDLAREQVAGLIGSSPGEIVFTSGATESDNLAIKGVAEMYASRGNHIVTCNTEHRAVLDSCAHLEKQGAEITRLKVNANGLPDLDELESAIRPTTVLVAIMYANNETGTVMPVKEISSIARKKNTLFFCDATQAVGKIKVDVNDDGIDLMAFSSHKMYGPKGVGALYVRRKDPRVRLTAQLDGGGHERAMRSGTLNTPGIVGFGKAADICREEWAEESSRLETLRNKLENGLLQLDQTFINGDRHRRLPHVLNMAFRYADGEALLTGLNREIAISSGAACTSASLQPSHVLKALGLGDDLAHSSLRFSLGRFTTADEIDYCIEKVKATVEHLRNLSPLWELHKAGTGTHAVEWSNP